MEGILGVVLSNHYDILTLNYKNPMFKKALFEHGV
jgi:hypothetical protein